MDHQVAAISAAPTASAACESLAPTYCMVLVIERFPSACQSRARKPLKVAAPRSWCYTHSLWTSEAFPFARAFRRAGCTLRENARFPRHAGQEKTPAVPARRRALLEPSSANGPTAACTRAQPSGRRTCRAGFTTIIGTAHMRVWAARRPSLAQAWSGTAY